MRQVRPYLFIGASVHPADVARLQRSRITAIVSLQQAGIDLPVPAMDRMRAACEPAIRFHNLGIADYNPDAVIAAAPDAVALLDALIGAGHVVYLHCSEGINRAPSIALAYLVRHERVDVDAAIAVLRACDAGARPYAGVIEWLRATAAAPR